MISKSAEVLRYSFGECWVGNFVLAQSEQGIRALFLGNDERQLLEDLQLRFPDATLELDTEGLQSTVAQVRAFADNLDSQFPADLDIHGTPFQKTVWSQLRQIPCGETVTYSDLANRIGKQSAFRAVANACGANPVSLIVPCHRVIRNDGQISGYRWGTDIKRKLLEHETKLRKNQ